MSYLRCHIALQKMLRCVKLSIKVSSFVSLLSYLSEHSLLANLAAHIFLQSYIIHFFTHFLPFLVTSITSFILNASCSGNLSLINASWFLIFSGSLGINIASFLGLLSFKESCFNCIKNTQRQQIQFKK